MAYRPPHLRADRTLFKKRFGREIRSIMEYKTYHNLFKIHTTDDMTCIHVIFRGPTNSLEKIGKEFRLHAVVSLPPRWPQAPPKIFLASPLPHPNVIERPAGFNTFVDHAYEVCLDTLAETTHHEPYRGWSSAITLNGLLFQIHAMLLDPSNLTHLQKCSHDEAVNEAKLVRCKLCHFENGEEECEEEEEDDDDDDDVKCSTPKASKLAPTCAMLKMELLPRVRRVEFVPPPRIARSVKTRRPSLRTGVSTVVRTANDNRSGAATTRRTSKSDRDRNWRRRSDDKDLEWQVVAGKTNVNEQSSIIGHSETTVHVSNVFECLQTRPKIDSNFAANVGLSEKAIQRKMEKLNEMDGTANAVRRLRRRLRKMRAASEIESKEEASHVESKKEATFKVESENDDAETTTTTTTFADSTVRSKAENACRCSFAIVGPILTWRICVLFLDDGSIQRLGNTCRYLQTCVADGRLWKLLYRRRRGGVFVDAPSSFDWKRQYALTVRHVFDDLTCYHTLSTPSDDVIGMPIDYTVNPKKKCIDHVFAPNDGVLSYTAFERMRVRHSAWNAPICGWIPLFISREHFERALDRKILHRAFVELDTENESRERIEMPEMALSVLSKMFSTTVILLAKKGGLTCSDRVLNGYLNSWRLMVAILEAFPDLQSRIRRRLERFVQFPSFRTKEREHSLGELLPLLSLCPDVAWKGAFSSAFMSESFDRGALWLFRAHPELATSKARSEISPNELLEKSFASRRMSMRITGIHVAFASVLAESRARMSNLVERFDYLLGHTPRDVLDGLKSRIRDVMDADDWQSLFRAIALAPPSPEKLTGIVERSIARSLKKGYHRTDMDFSRIMRSGTSRILMRGDTLEIGHLGRIEMEDIWRWDGNRKFLDATLLLFDADGSHVGLLDYTHTRLFGGAARHSGDVMNDGERQGSHRIQLDLRRLPKRVQYVFFVISAFAGVKLNEIKHPTVVVYDSDSGTAVCSYEFSSKKGLEEHSSVVMGRLWRPSCASAWQFSALGHMGQGEAQDYDPIVESIQATILRQK